MSLLEAKPSFDIRFQDAPYGLRCQVFGVNGTLETTLLCWRRIALEVSKRRPAGVLVMDEMEGEPPPPEDLLKFVQAMRGTGLETVRVAYVEHHPQQIPQVELAGILANEHGFNGRVFGNEEEASVWLRYGEP